MFNLNCFPNPAKDNFTISYKIKTSKAVKIIITDIAGMEVLSINNSQQPVGDYNILVNISTLENGLYFLRFSDGINIEQRKIVVLK